MNEHQKAIEAELSEYLTERISIHAGDFDAWLRDDDPDAVEYCYELIESLADVLARPLTRSQKEHRLERFWTDLYREIAEEYAHAAAWDDERGFFRSYADRRGW